MHTLIVSKVFHYGDEDGLKSWSEPETIIDLPYESTAEKKIGYLSVNATMLKETSLPDIDLADKAMEKLSNFKETQTEKPFFLALGFRYVKVCYTTD